MVGLFRPSRPDFIETLLCDQLPFPRNHTLFRPSRPDFIETTAFTARMINPAKLFRPSRPDFIETHLGESAN